MILATYGNWDVLKISSKDKRRWLCRCRCERRTKKWQYAANLTSGRSKSCGCLAMKHAVSAEGWLYKQRPYHPLWRTWQGMHERCSCDTHLHFADYGGRGIRVCSRWSGVEGFDNFARDMGERPAGTLLERRDNAGNYTPKNCYWATRVEQNRNRRNNHLLTHDGRTQCISAWAEETGISKITIKSRIRMKWSESDAVTIRPGEKRTSKGWR